MIYPLIILSLIGTTVSLQCNVLNTIQGLSTMACPPFVYQCMKFTCDSNGMTSVYKGCNDLSNPPVSCTSLLTNCMAINGKGKCHTCTGELCNGVVRASFPFILLIPSLLLFLI
ncbi:hypothetical protein PMAYCL1PPCAC_29344 [Pristionchus mayeri]|uniref:Uncharacterized protein n=1 Tax=Pristionchus mayeri TaxID=1317129 RepID=A0AAN5D9W0_9BILA|nr:hypothetical protein PMAYCL1PPCAC_29344 [Pristionchus mayeri]